jgi:polynucleotide 5'-kinase involved in rRNA processing
MKERLSGKLFQKLKVDIPADWQRILDYFASKKRYRVLVVGGLDVGKSTLASLIISTSTNACLLEADPGQPGYLIPGVFSLVDKTGKVKVAYFVGDISPARNITDVLQGVFLLGKKAEGQNIVVDTSGYVLDDQALELKIAKAVLVKADHAVLIEKDQGELDKYAYHFEKLGLTVLKCRSSEAAKSYSHDQRRKRREALLKNYFKEAQEDFVEVEKHALVNLSEKGPFENLVFAFENEKGFCEQLGLIRDLIAENNHVIIKFLSPMKPERFARIKIGRLRVPV